MFTAALRTYVVGITSVCEWLGRGSEGLLWRREVNQHYVLEENSAAQIYSHRQTCAESKLKKTQQPTASQSDNDTAKRRDYLTFISVSNVTQFCGRVKTTS